MAYSLFFILWFLGAAACIRALSKSGGRDAGDHRQ